jgi:hypothetical protein
MTLASFTTTVIAVSLVASVARAQGAYKRELPDSLNSQAKIVEHVAAKTALSKVPKVGDRGGPRRRGHGAVHLA